MVIINGLYLSADATAFGRNLNRNQVLKYKVKKQHVEKGSVTTDV